MSPLPAEDTTMAQGSSEESSKKSRPTTTQTGHSPDFLVVSKKRKLQLVADPDETIGDPIPLKSRSLSVTQPQRITSLTAAPKPELPAPKSPPAATVDSGVPSVKSKSDTSEQLKDEEVAVEVDQQKQYTVKELRKQEFKLDIDLRKAKLQLHALKRARDIVNRNETEKIEQLIDKWRDAAQKASNFLLNAAIDKINRSGGKREFKRREKDHLRESIEYSIDNSFQDRTHEITNSEQYRVLSEKEKERILEDLDKQQEEALEEAEKTFLKSEENDESEDEFSMKDLYKKLRLNYNLVFPYNE